MGGIIAKTWAKLAVRWHRTGRRLYTARIEALLAAGEPYISPKLSRISGKCAAHGIKAVAAAKKGGFYKRGRIVPFPNRRAAKSVHRDSLEQ